MDGSTGELTVGLLIADSINLLGFHQHGSATQQGLIILDQDVLDLLLGSLIHIVLAAEGQGLQQERDEGQPR